MARHEVITPAVWRGGIIGAAAAAAGNLAIYGVGRAADVAFLVPTWGGGPAMHVTAVHVALSSILPLFLGTAVAVAASRRGWLRPIAAAAAVVAVLSLGGPLSLDADTATKVLLASMHVVAGVAFVLALERARRPRVVHTAPSRDDAALTASRVRSGS